LRTLRTALWHLRKGGPTQLSKWRRRRAIAQGVSESAREFAASCLTEDNLEELFPPMPIPRCSPVFADVRVGVILDEFSEQSLGFEWTTIPLSRAVWPNQLDELDFVLVESAWNGNDGDWKYKLTGTSGPSAEIIALLAECRRRGLPTVFWNKEDPPHFDDFLPLAKLVDVVFTSDSRLIPDYQSVVGHDEVAALPFAAQPAIHNPTRPVKNFAARDIAFAGMYFAHKYP